MNVISNSLLSNIICFNLRLSFVEEKDLPLLCRWRNSPEVRKFMGDTREVNVEILRFWLNKVIRSSTAYAWIAHYNNIPVGFLELKNIDHTLSSCERGVFFEKDHIGKGLGFYLALSCEVILKRISINILINNVHYTNMQSIRYLNFMGLNYAYKENNTLIYITNQNQRYKHLRRLAHRLHVGEEWDSLFPESIRGP